MSQQINLFNPIFLQKKQLVSAVTMAQALGLLAVGIVALAFYGNWRVSALQKEADAGARQLEQKQARLAGVAKDFVPRQKKAELEAELASAEAQLTALRQVSGVLERGEFGNTQGYSAYFKALARQHVEGLWLTSVAIMDAGNQIAVRGRALDPALLPVYLGKLKHEPVMQGKVFGSLQIAQAAPVKSVDKDGKEFGGPAPYVDFSLQSTADEAQK